MNLVNVESKIEDNKSILLLYFREGEKRIVKKVDWFPPYFYVDIPVPNQSPSKITLDGKLVWKVEANNTREIYNLRNLYPRVYEADIEFTRRFMIDNVKKLGKAQYRTMTIDIETTTDFGFPIFDDPVETITLITIHDSLSNKLVTFAVRPDEKDYNLNDEISLVNREGKVIGTYSGRILLFDDEVTMLKNFIKTWAMLQPDLVVGWNVTHFDLIYLFSRIQKLNVPVPFEYYFRKSHGKLEGKDKVEVVIEGSIGFDLLLGYKTIRFQELPSYSLDWVSKYELNMEHPKRRILNFTKFWKERFEEFVEYNRNDVALTVKLNEVAGIVDYFEDIRSISLLPRLDMVNTRSKAIDNVLLSHFNQYAYPTRNFDAEEEDDEEEDKGGYVMDPKIGVYEDVDVIDFSGMYPSIIRTFNLSPETIVSEGGDYTLHIPNKGMENGIPYTAKRRGILPQLVEYMQTLRDNYTRLRDESKTPEEYRRWDQKRFAAKTVINALYGTMLYRGYRLHDERVGYSITYLGRELNKYVHKRLREHGVEVLYGDTDSSFVKHDMDTKEMLKMVNDVFVPEFVHNISPLLTSYIRADLDKHYDWICFVAKKRYYGVKKNRKGEELWDFVGVDIKRTNVPAIITDSIKEVLNVFRAKGDVISKIDEVVEYIRSSNDAELFRIPLKLEIDADEYKVNTYTKKAVKKAEEVFGLKFRRGDKFWGVYLKDGMIAFDELDDERTKYVLQNLDRSKYVKDFIHKTLHLALMEDREKEFLTKYGMLKNKFSNTVK
ncbi:MAG: DNA polymerase domain-containing protein [Candidatus Acidifodinimicrobium sp.]